MGAKKLLMNCFRQFTLNCTAKLPATFVANAAHRRHPGVDEQVGQVAGHEGRDAVAQGEADAAVRDPLHDPQQQLLVDRVHHQLDVPHVPPGHLHQRLGGLGGRQQQLVAAPVVLARLGHQRLAHLQVARVAQLLGEPDGGGDAGVRAPGQLLHPQERGFVRIGQEDVRDAPLPRGEAARHGLEPRRQGLLGALDHRRAARPSGVRGAVRKVMQPV